MKRPITFRLPFLHPDLAPLVERHRGTLDFSNCTYFGRGDRGNDEMEYVLDGDRLYEIYFEDMDVMLGLVAKDQLTEQDVSITIVEDGERKRDILADLAEQIRVRDHTEGKLYYTPPGEEPEVAPQRYWINKQQSVLDLTGAKVTEKDGKLTADVSPDEDQN
jgi:hypothetical protein